MALALIAIGAILTVVIVLSVIDIDINQTRRIEKQVARDVNRIRAKTIKGWDAERIANRYPRIPPEHIRQVRRAMERHQSATEEVDLLRSLWSIDIPEPD
ncbi:MAG: hypothetical protein HKN74_05110 [Acidimicrobiia bacterium]|nr:hypothetical protein [Acidimicrobiia bacterium]MBT8215584.1 hypothetical protein [Acidimicrobiia bacterium]NNF09646.1 hypothetical protein [Acidimicrobiia bacterium]NNL71713.1 hypothetical protein [Acidimicrobiia bacterium]